MSKQITIDICIPIMRQSVTVGVSPDTKIQELKNHIIENYKSEKSDDFDLYYMGQRLECERDISSYTTSSKNTFFLLVDELNVPIPKVYEEAWAECSVASDENILDMLSKLKNCDGSVMDEYTCQRFIKLLCNVGCMCDGKTKMCLMNKLRGWDDDDVCSCLVGQLLKLRTFYFYTIYTIYRQLTGMKRISELDLVNGLNQLRMHGCELETRDLLDLFFLLAMLYGNDYHTTSLPLSGSETPGEQDAVVIDTFRKKEKDFTTFILQRMGLWLGLEVTDAPERKIPEGYFVETYPFLVRMSVEDSEEELGWEEEETLPFPISQCVERFGGGLSSEQEHFACYQYNTNLNKKAATIILQGHYENLRSGAQGSDMQ